MSSFPYLRFPLEFPRSLKGVNCAGLSDVASILARRVALEVSDSDEGPSDSEYDSDDWGKNQYICCFLVQEFDPW